MNRLPVVAGPQSDSIPHPVSSRPDRKGLPESSAAHGIELNDVIRIAFVALAAAAVWFRWWEPFPRISVIGVAATLIGGYPIFKEAFENALERKMTMELSMTIALLSALTIREFFTALVITGFVLAAEVIEGLTVGRGRRAIKRLVDFLPRTVLVRRESNLVEIPLEELGVGEITIVKPGAHIAIDGLVINGRSFVDQSAITGEAMPAEKAGGDYVYAGTLNQSGALEVQADRLGRDTTFGRIIEAVENAEHSRAPIQKTADRLAGYLVYFALGAAILTFALTHNIRSTISVVIVAGACGIAAGTPLAILGAIGRAARQGSIIKGGIHLEALGTVDTVILDKTGTLTFGTPKVSDVISANGFEEREIVAAASIAESRSEHPLAKAVMSRAAELGIPATEPEDFAYTPGRGVRVMSGGELVLVGNRLLMEEHGLRGGFPANGNSAGYTSEVIVARGGKVLGTLRIADVLRPEARSAVMALRKMGLKTVLLSGDAQAVTSSVGKDLGVDDAVGELLPEQKAEWVAKLRSNGRKVAMVGDGINDAPALVRADVGIAMGSGTDVARETADVILIGSDLSKFVDTVRIARNCRSIIMQNFAGTLIVDSIGVGMAAFGLLNPLLAASVHVVSELVFILNSTRLLPRNSEARS